MTGPFDRICKAALVLGTGASLPASPDFSIFMYEAA